MIISGIMFFGFKIMNKNDSHINVVHRDEVVKKINTDLNKKYSFKGTYGDVKVEVKDGEFRITEEECPNHICSALGWIKIDSGMPIICLPNEVVVVLDGD